MGVLAILAEAGMYIAQERGYFAEEAINADFITFDTGAKAIPALATSQVDASGGAFSPGLVNAVQRGVDVKMVGSLSTYEQGFNSGYLMLRKELADSGAIRDWPDFRGRSIAIPPGRPTVGDYTVARGLALGGLKLPDVNIVELPFPDMIPAFANGSIDASHTSEPFSTLASDRGVVEVEGNRGLCARPHAGRADLRAQPAAQPHGRWAAIHGRLSARRPRLHGRLQAGHRP